MGRVLHITFKVGLVAGVIAATVVIGRKLMGGLGPEPGSPAAPTEYPSLVPEPPAGFGHGNGSANGSANSSSPTAEEPARAEEPAPAEASGEVSGEPDNGD